MVMRVRVILPLGVLLAGAFPALAQNTCTEPPPPPPIDGAQANADQLRAAMGQAHDFMALSEMYQACLVQSADADAKLRIAASQRAQETVGKSINTALDTYKRTHAN
jgi:hypothetical protein